MGYTVKASGKPHGHYETKEEAYAVIKKEVCKGTMPAHVHTSTRGVDYFIWWSGVIAVIPDPKTPA